MADEKPKDKAGGAKKPEAPAASDPITNIIGVILLFAVVTTIITSVSTYIRTNGLTFFGVPIAGAGSWFTTHLWLFRTFAYLVSGAAAVGIVVFSRRAGEIFVVEKAKLFPGGEAELGGVQEEDSEIKLRWQKILENSLSTNESSWRIAVIEADVILDDLLDQLHLPGDTIGEKLKAVEKSDFLTIESAWEAHKVRNEIAHGGSSFHLSQRDTGRVIALYEQVFKEFYLI